jgi:hypothetical protein
MRLLASLCLFASALAVAGCGSKPAPGPVTGVTVAPDDPDEPSAPRGERVENPAYTRWAKCAPGAFVTYAVVTDIKGAVTKRTSTAKLAKRTEEVAVVESEDWAPAPGGGKADVQSQELKQLRWMGKPGGPAAADPARPPGTYADGTETITVGGKEYKARWYKFKGRVEAGETDTQVWYSDEVPGGLVKSIHRIDASGKVTTIEVAEVKLP